MAAPSASTAETKSDVSFTSVRASIGEVDTNRQQVGAEGAHAHAVELRQQLQSLVWIVVGHQMRDAPVPPPLEPHPHIRVGLDVLHVLRLLAELGDEPELVADPTAA